MISELGNLNSLKVPRSIRKGSIPGGQGRYPNFDQYVKLHAAWVADWDKTFGYRSERHIEEDSGIMTAPP